MPLCQYMTAAALLLLGEAAAMGQGFREPGPDAGIAAAAQVSSAQVEKAIARAKVYLYSQQRDGNWEESPTKQAAGGGMGGMMGARGRDPEASSQWGGLSSIATFALLAAGESDQDPRIEKAVYFLQGTNDVTGTYALGLHAQVWPLLPPSKFSQFKPSVHKDGTVLLRGLRQAGDARGLYHYTPDDPGWDNSASQFGVLGMWACAQLGFEVPSRYWRDVEDAWIRHQDKSGGWRYGGDMGGPGMGPNGPGMGPDDMRGPPGRQGGPPEGPGQGRGGGGPMRPGRGFGPPDSNVVTLSMTAAGVATLFITQDYLHSDGGCKGNYTNRPLEAGLKWIGQHFGELASVHHYYYYTLFGISRIGLASGYKYLGDRDWYKDGAAQLVAYQQLDGSWQDSVSDTSFALLFLARGGRRS